MSKWRANIRDEDGSLIDTITCHRRFEKGEHISVICPPPPIPQTADVEVMAVVYLTQVDGRVREHTATGEVCIVLRPPEAAIYRKALKDSRP